MSVLEPQTQQSPVGNSVAFDSPQELPSALTSALQPQQTTTLPSSVTSRASPQQSSSSLPFHSPSGASLNQSEQQHVISQQQESQTPQPSTAFYSQCSYPGCAASPASQSRIGGGGGGVPRTEDSVAPFVSKLYSLVSDPSNHSYIAWSDEHFHRAFVVWDPAEFSAVVLPRFFKHSNFSSFVRQLNTYGFHKVDSKLGFTFRHEFFRENAPALLKRIQRRKSVHKKTPVVTDPLVLAAVVSASSAGSGCESFATSSPSSAASVNDVKCGASPVTAVIGCEGASLSPDVLQSMMSASPQNNSQLYMCLHDEIAKLRQQNSETQNTIIQLKEMLIASRAREDSLFSLYPNSRSLFVVFLTHPFLLYVCLHWIYIYSS